MTDNNTLMQLITQSDPRIGDLGAIRAMIEEAAEKGAANALIRLGLGDESAPKDMAELRELLGAWRDAKASATKAVIGWLVRGLLAALLIGIAVKLGLGGLVRP